MLANLAKPEFKILKKLLTLRKNTKLLILIKWIPKLSRKPLIRVSLSNHQRRRWRPWPRMMLQCSNQLVTKQGFQIGKMGSMMYTLKRNLSSRTTHCHSRGTQIISRASLRRRWESWRSNKSYWVPLGKVKQSGLNLTNQLLSISKQQIKKTIKDIQLQLDLLLVNLSLKL